MKKILVALDYSPFSEKVAETGYTLAQALGSELALVHVITEAAYYAIEYSPIIGYNGGYKADTVAMENDIKKEAQIFLAASVNHLGNNSIKTKVLKGNTSDSILDYANEWNADLIVICSHRHKGIEKLLVTDLATHILKHSKIPLLTIPTNDN